jgi:hypothetical protein
LNFKSSVAIGQSRESDLILPSYFCILSSQDIVPKPAMSAEKKLEKVLRGDSDANIRFEELCLLLQSRGFRMRVNGSHHILRRQASWNA